jgi:hypothetical protein
MAGFQPPDFARLLDWIEGRLSDDEAQAVAAQVAEADATTKATVDWLRAFHQTSAELVFDQPPSATHDLLVRRFAAYAQTRQQPSMLRRLFASLAFDSSLGPALAGVRGADDSAARRQLIFNSELADLAINIVRRPADRRFDLSGQVFLKAEPIGEPLTLHLLRQDSELEATHADELGEFTFAGLASGEYTLLLRSDVAEVVIAPVELLLEP